MARFSLRRGSGGRGSGGSRRSVGADANELKELVLAYVRQETLDPLKALGRFLGFGVAGALLVSIGALLLTLGALRAIQTEAGVHLSGNLTWVPYFGAVILALAIAGLAASRIGKVR